MDIEKIREVRRASQHMINRIDEVLEQANRNHNAKFILADGNHARMLKKAGNWLKAALEGMKKP